MDRRHLRDIENGRNGNIELNLFDFSKISDRFYIKEGRLLAEDK